MPEKDFKEVQVTKKRVVWLLLVLFGAVALFSIWALADEAQPQYGGHLIWAEPYDPGTLDPGNITDDGSSYVAWQVYQALLEVDPYQRPIPALAESWEQTNKETYIFHLRHGVHWQDGNELWAEGEAPEVTAEDVVYTYNRVLDPDNALARKAELLGVDEVKALDRYTVKIHLSAPDAFFLSRAVPAISIIPKTLVEKGLIAKHPIGSGPFEFVSYSPGEQIVFKKNEDFWMPVYLDGMTMRIIPEKQVAVMAIEAGDVDIVTQVNPTSVPRLKEEGFLVMAGYPGSYRYLAFNTKNPPWDNVNMRKAIAHAVNRDQLIKVAFAGVSGLAEPAYQHESPAYVYHDPVMKKLPMWSYDLEKARALLKEEGWIDTDGDGILDKNGQKLSLEILTPSADPNRKKIGVILTTELKKELGIDASTRALEWGTYLDRIQVLPPTNDVQAYIIGGYSDPKGLYMLFSSDTWGPGGNSCFYSNPNVDTLLKEGLAATPAELLPLWREAQVLIYADVPHIPLYFEYTQEAIKPTVHGCALYYVARFNNVYTQVWMEKK